MSATTALRQHTPTAFAPSLLPVLQPVPSAVPSADELHEVVYGPRPAVTPPQRESAAVYRRRRLAFLVVVLLIGLGGWSLASAVVTTTSAPIATTPAATEPTVHVVQPGDTLWSIAATIDVDGDVRDTVDRLADRNGGSALEVGQRLVLD